MKESSLYPLGLSSSRIPKRVSLASSSLQLSARTRAVHSTTPSHVLSLFTYHLTVGGRSVRVLARHLFEHELVAAGVLDCAPALDDLGDGAHRIARAQVHHPDALGRAAL